MSQPNERTDLRLSLRWLIQSTKLESLLNPTTLYLHLLPQQGGQAVHDGARVPHHFLPEFDDGHLAVVRGELDLALFGFNGLVCVVGMLGVKHGGL